MNLDKLYEDLCLYLKKLERAINGSALVFVLGKYKIVKKEIVDDIMCCLDLCFPKEIIQNNNIRVKPFECVKLYQDLKRIVQHVFFLNKDWYVISGDVKTEFDKLQRTYKVELETMKECREI